MRTVTCQVCGKTFETVSTRAKFCGPTCRSRAHRNTAEVVPLPADEPVPEDAPLLVATKAELERAGVTDTALGQHAIELARRMTHPKAIGLSVAPISKELRTVMVEAMRVAPAASSLDELRARRDAKRNAG